MFCVHGVIIIEQASATPRKESFYAFVYLLKDSGLILDFSEEKAYSSYSILSSVTVDGGPSKEMIVRLKHM